MSFPGSEMMRAYLNAFSAGDVDAVPFLWVSRLSRGLLDSGEFQEMVARGVTGADLSAEAMARTLGRRLDLADDVRSLHAAGMDQLSICEALLAEDVSEVADELGGIHAATGGATGMVSTDGPWILADNPGELALRAKRFWHRVARPNVMLNLSATDCSLRALPALLAAGVSVNLTGVCSVARLDDVWDAWISAVSASPEGRRLPAVAISVAPFRVGGLVDRRIGEVKGLPAWAPAWQLVGRAGHALARQLHARHEWHCASQQIVLGAVPGQSLPTLHWLYDKVACGCESALECLRELPLTRTTLVLPQSELVRWIRTSLPGSRTQTQAQSPDRDLESELSMLGISMGELASQVEAEAASECDDDGRSLGSSIAGLCQPGN
jgi:hypothetical protein